MSTENSHMFFIQSLTLNNYLHTRALNVILHYQPYKKATAREQVIIYFKILKLKYTITLTS